MNKFVIRILSTKDGTWQAFQADWVAQSDQVGEPFEEYSPENLSIIKRIAEGLVEQTKQNRTMAVAIMDEVDGRHYAVCMANRAGIPGTTGFTLRVRHLIASPILDFGEVPTEVYANVLIAAVGGIIQLSESDLRSEHIRFHLRSPEDMAFFRIMGNALGQSGVFASVQARGAWLMITK